MKSIILPIIIFALFIYFTIGCDTSNDKSESKIKGEMVESLTDDDSIFFFSGSLKEDYYEISILKSGIKDKKFTLSRELNYPHLYWINLKSERNNIPQRGGYYFIDSSTQAIKVDSIGECSIVAGKTQKEFTTKFLPFVSKDYSCNNIDLGKLEFRDGTKFNERLLEYIVLNPDSYVALWLLINRIDIDGFQTIFKESLSKFSPKIKEHKIWILANLEVENFRIKKDEKFPELNLKNINLEKVILQVPKGKYTLVDFWFSSCIPCLKQYPTLKKIYEKYNSKGFEILGISVDRTHHIEKWGETIKSHQLPWINFLDENGILSSEEKITSFPTTFLLNKKGIIIKKNITVEELNAFLEKELK